MNPCHYRWDWDSSHLCFSCLLGCLFPKNSFVGLVNLLFGNFMHAYNAFWSCLLSTSLSDSIWAYTPLQTPHPSYHLHICPFFFYCHHLLSPIRVSCMAVGLGSLTGAWATYHQSDHWGKKINWTDNSLWMYFSLWVHITQLIIILYQWVNQNRKKWLRIYLNQCNVSIQARGPEFYAEHPGKKPGAEAQECDLSVGEVEMRITGAFWPANIVETVGPRSKWDTFPV